jgi:hypothetical protein
MQTKLTSALDIFSKLVQHVSPKKEMKILGLWELGDFTIPWYAAECGGNLIFSRRGKQEFNSIASLQHMTLKPILGLMIQ